MENIGGTIVENAVIKRVNEVEVKLKKFGLINIEDQRFLLKTLQHVLGNDTNSYPFVVISFAVKKEGGKTAYRYVFNAQNVPFVERAKMIIDVAMSAAIDYGKNLKPKSNIIKPSARINADKLRRPPG